MKIISTLIFLLFSSVVIAQNLLPEVVVIGDNSKPSSRQTITKEVRQAAETDLEFPFKKQSQLNIRMGCYLCCAPARTTDTIKTIAFKLPVFNSKSNDSSVSNCKISGDTLNKIRLRNLEDALEGKPIKGKIACGPVRLKCAVKVPDSLYVVNGEYFTSIDCVNADDIEDITVLQPPAAQAIFGEIGKNGITVVTLKMKYDRITIKDLTDKNPIPKATISFVFPERKDTLRYIADDSGIVMSSSLAKLRGCEMIVTAIGYETESRVFYRLDHLSNGTIFLKKDIKELKSVVLSTIVCGRMIRCGVRCVRIIGCEIKKLRQSEAKDINIFPNPVEKGGYFRISKELDRDEALRLRIFQANGSLAGEHIVKGIKGINLFSFKTGSNWSAGVYFVQLIYENGRVAASAKLIIQ